MKVTSTDHLDHLQQNGKAHNQRLEAGQDQGFSRLIDSRKETEAPGQASDTGGQTASKLLESSSFVGLILAGQKVGESGPAPEKQLENTLDKIEEYALALGDFNRTLKDIEPLANDLKKAAGELTELSRNLPESDPLKSLSNEAAVLATVEAMKFRRGDYI